MKKIKNINIEYRLYQVLVPNDRFYLTNNVPCWKDSYLSDMSDCAVFNSLDQAKKALLDNWENIEYPIKGYEIAIYDRANDKSLDSVFITKKEQLIKGD